MDNIIFDDSLKLGIAEVDAQHRRFIDYLNESRSALRSGADHQTLIHLLNRVRDYAFEHFACEESLMIESDYPKYAAHRNEHNKTIDKIFEFDYIMQGDSQSAAVEFVDFLSGWLVHHIGKEDREMADFINHHCPQNPE